MWGVRHRTFVQARVIDSLKHARNVTEDKSGETQGYDKGWRWFKHVSLGDSSMKPQRLCYVTYEPKSIPQKFRWIVSAQKGILFWVVVNVNSPLTFHLLPWSFVIRKRWRSGRSLKESDLKNVTCNIHLNTNNPIPEPLTTVLPYRLPLFMRT